MAKDFLNKEIEEGMTVGGVTSGRYSETISGTVVKVGKGQVKVNVEKSSRSHASKGTDKWISQDRVFVINS